MLSSARRTDSANASRSPARRLARDLGEDRGVDRLCEHGVRSEEEHERGLVRDHTARHRVADHERGAEQHAGAGVQEHAPERELQQPAHRRIPARAARPQPEPGPPAGDESDADEGDDAAGARDREQQTLACR